MKKIFFLALFFSAVILAGCLQEKEKVDSGTFPAQTEIFQQNGLLEQRKAYGIPLSVFEELPSAPSDFNEIVSLYHKRIFSYEGFFSEKYFLQPEFYPSFMESGLNYWLNPSTTHWGAYGYGSFPTNKTVFLSRSGKTRIVFFMHSGYGVQNFQGIQLQSKFNEPGAENFFDVNILEPVFLIGPNFPKFDKSWAKAVFIDISAKDTAPDGIFSAGISVSLSPQEFRDKWAKKLGGQYVDAASASLSRPPFEFIAIVK